MTIQREELKSKKRSNAATGEKIVSAPQRHIDEICSGNRGVILKSLSELGDKIDHEVMPLAA